MRGGLASFMQLQSNMGVAFVNALNIGQALHWVRISWVCMAVPGKNSGSNMLKSIKSNPLTMILTIFILMTWPNSFASNWIILASGISILPHRSRQVRNKHIYSM